MAPACLDWLAMANCGLAMPAGPRPRAFIDTMISIDPDWLSQHRGYSVVVDDMGLLH